MVYKIIGKKRLYPIKAFMQTSIEDCAREFSSDYKKMFRFERKSYFYTRNFPFRAFEWPFKVSECTFKVSECTFKSLEQKKP